MLVCQVQANMRFFTIQYASNLFVHKNDSWKYAKKLLKVRASPNLALLGNIGIPLSHKTKEFVRWCSDTWENVYCVPGPCELQYNDHLFGLFKKMPKNVFILDQTVSAPHNNLTILGCPLWTGHAPLIQKYSSWSEEEQYCMAFKPANTLKNWHEDDYEFLQDRIKNSQATYGPSQQIVLLTHHLPHKSMLPSLPGEKERQIILHDGNIRDLFSPHVVGCLSGAGGGSVSGFLSQYKTFCGVNCAFQGQNMVPNRQYRPDMIASFPLDIYPQSPEGAIRSRVSLRDILPFPKVAIAYANPILQ